MQKILKASFAHRLVAAIYSWFGSQFRASRIISRFLTPGRGELVSSSSVFTRAWLALHRLLCWIFDKIRLTRLLRGSIFTMPFIWTSLALVLAPILPTLAVLGLTLVSMFSLLLAFGCDRDRKLAYSPINKFVLIYAFIYTASIFTSVTVSGSLFGGALTVLFVLAAVAFQNAISTRRQLDTIICAFVISGAAVSAYGIYQYVFGFTGASAWLDSEMFTGVSVRVYSTLENPNVLAEYLLLVIPFAAAFILISKKPVIKLFFLCCLGAMLVCMLLTFARGGWLGLIAAAAVFLVMLDRRFILLGIAGLIAMYFVLPDVILNRFMSIGNLGDTSTAYRLSIWLGTIAMLRDFWFTGIGPGTAAFNKVYPLYSYNTVSAPHSHNLYLQVMCDAGILGIIIFIIILFSYFKMLCCAIARADDKSSKILQIAAVSSVFGFLIQSMTDYSFYNYRVTLVFWAVLGLGTVIARRGSLLKSDNLPL